MSGCCLMISMACRPLVALTTSISWFSSMVVSAKMLRASSSTTSALRPRNTSLELCRRVEHLAAWLRADSATTRCRNSAVSSNSRSGDCTSLSTMLLASVRKLFFLLGGQFLAGENHDRHVAQGPVRPAFFPATSKPAHVRQAQIQHAAVKRPVQQHLQRLGAGADGRDLDVIMAQQFHDAFAFHFVVLHHQQPFDARSDECLDAVETLFQALRRGRLDRVGKRAVRQAMLALLLHGNDLHGNMAGGGIQFQIVQHRPAEHVRQENVEGDGRRQILPRQRQRRVAARGGNAP